MIKPEQLWDAIVNIAKWRGMSCSGLAKFSGLDATTFNKSKRITKYGTYKWPSTLSLAKVLSAVNLSLGEFARRFMPKD
ncbi:MAG: hypothetical protein J6T57_03900 [Alphaproteobacteria bacterium]|nr:hypothetical protein [Alphaproteobacteria bacterium]